MKVGTPLNWSMDLIEINDVQADVIHSNIQMNGMVLKAKQDTGTQINIMSMTVFRHTESLEATIIPQVLYQACWLWEQNY